MNITLRPFQSTANKKINSLLNSGVNPVFVSPTGTGKTKTAVKLSHDRTTLKETIWILCPQVEIFNQWLKDFAEAGISGIVGYINDKGVTGRNKKIYVCMPLSLSNLLPVLPETFKPSGIITDEGHRSEAATWQEIYNHCPNAWRLCLTATPQRYDGQGLINTYDRIVQTITMQQAINDGYLAQPLLIVPEQYKMDVPIQNGEYNTAVQAKLLGKTQIIGDVIKQYKKVFNGLPIMVACSTYEHATMMTQAFSDSGWCFEHIHSGLSMSDRAGMIRRIRNGETNGLCTVGIGIEGLDIPGLYGLIWLRRTMSVTIYLQLIGRILRPFQGKKYGIIIDPVGNCFIHGRPEMDRIWSLDGRDDVRPDDVSLAPTMKTCPECTVMNSSENKNCHICGFDFTGPAPPTKGRKIPKMVDGKLVVLDDTEVDGMPDLSSIVNKIVDKSNCAIELTVDDKLKLLKTGFESKNSMFAETLRKYM